MQNERSWGQAEWLSTAGLLVICSLLQRINSHVPCTSQGALPAQLRPSHHGQSSFTGTKETESFASPKFPSNPAVNYPSL